MIKPLYGLLTDFVPIMGSRRKSWLVLWTGATSLALILLWLVPLKPGSGTLLLILLIVPTIGIAFTDVVVDALMVEEGQPRGITGTLQSVQWAAMSGAMILTGWLGGYLSGHGMQTTGFVICASTAAFSFFLVLKMVKEPDTKRPEGTPKAAAVALLAAARHPAVIGVAAFLFLVNFSPFGSSVRYYHLTEYLGLSETQYGKMVSTQAVAAVVAAASYGWICRRVPFRVLIHIGIGGAVLATLSWYWVSDMASALSVAVFFGFMLMITALVQLDMAARYCPPALAATVFALLMSVCNAAASLSEYVGGSLYTWWTPSQGEAGAFASLVVLGAAATSLCWQIVPWLNRLESAQAAEVAAAGPKSPGAT